MDPVHVIAQAEIAVVAPAAGKTAVDHLAAVHRITGAHSTLMAAKAAVIVTALILAIATMTALVSASIAKRSATSARDSILNETAIARNAMATYVLVIRMYLKIFTTRLTPSVSFANSTAAWASLGCTVPIK